MHHLSLKTYLKNRPLKFIKFLYRPDGENLHSSVEET